MTRRRLMWTISAATVVAAVAAGLFWLRGIPGATRPHETVGAQAQTLREAFNAETGTVRVIALVSPTCGACLRGAADIQTGVFDKLGDPRLRGFIVWVPKLGAHEHHVPEATHLIADPRAAHYWDADGYLVHAYDQTLGLGQDAWDIYLLYGPQDHWDGDLPPAPQYWMTQLAGTDGPSLDPAIFADHARTLLG